MTPTAFVQPESQAAARLHGRVLARQTLDTRTRNAMFSLLSAHFVGVDRTTFDRDLEDKSCAILLEDDAGDLRGFSTMVVYESRAAGTPVSVVYSGDTIVDPFLIISTTGFCLVTAQTIWEPIAARRASRKAIKSREPSASRGSELIAPAPD